MTLAPPSSSFAATAAGRPHGALLAINTRNVALRHTHGPYAWQPGGLLKKRLNAAGKASEYKPQEPDPELEGAQAHCSWS